MLLGVLHRACPGQNDSFCTALCRTNEILLSIGSGWQPAWHAGSLAGRQAVIAEKASMAGQAGMHG